MFELLSNFTQQPEPFSVYSAPQLWTHPHISKQMLRAHLDPNSDRASRRPATISASVEWIDQVLELSGKKVCDLGCGPGLYTSLFHDKGSHVIGLDVSGTSLTHAIKVAKETGRSINYVKADYTQTGLPQEMDIFTLIFCDYCALSPVQRSSLLNSIGSALVSGGHLVMDVLTLSDFAAFQERVLIERRLMDGFWSSGDYVGLMKSFKYERQKVSLDRYLVVEPVKQFEIFNWLQYFSRESLEAELAGAGFKIKAFAGSLTGEPVPEGGRSFGVVAGAA